MKKVIIWGMGDNYERLLNQILFEIHKGNISIEAIACRKQDKYCSIRDGFPVIVKEEIKPDNFDYLIITSTKYFKEIKEEAKELGIEENRIINGQLFHQPLFDFAKYVSLIENPVTILSDDCWGVWHTIDLVFLLHLHLLMSIGIVTNIRYLYKTLCFI